MKRMCEEFDLLYNRDNVIRVPFLIKGKIVVPPEIDKKNIEAAFAQADKEAVYLKFPEAQFVRERVIDRKTMSYTGEYVYQVMPSILAEDLVETDIDKLAAGLYALSVEDILDYLSAIANVVSANADLAVRVLETGRLTTELPDVYLNGWLASISASFDRETARQMIDAELSLWGKPGSEFLEGWVEVPSRIAAGLVSECGRALFGGSMGAAPSKSFIRAMPTRQLHITAGNAPEVPVVSALRAILTKSAAVVKLPFGATLTGSMLAVVMAGLPDHPLTQNMSLVYWQGGDESIENPLLMPGAFDRIVVWGGPEAVMSVQSRSLYTRTLCFNPRYAVSLIGREAFGDGLEEVALEASADSMIYNQKACTASLVHYIEGTEDQVEQYAEILRETLDRWDRRVPQFILPYAKGQLKRMKRGKYSNARWHVNEKDGEFTSGVVVMPGEFDILDHPLCRLVVVRRVDNLTDVLRYLHQGVSTVGIYPEERRLSLRDLILARGVSNVFPLGQCERMFAGMPHDGMPVLSQLVNWKNS